MSDVPICGDKVILRLSPIMRADPIDATVFEVAHHPRDTLRQGASPIMVRLQVEGWRFVTQPLLVTQFIRDQTDEERRRWVCQLV